MWFSIFVGLTVVFILPMAIAVMFADEYRGTPHSDRLTVWNGVTLIGTSLLAAWTRLWVRPYGMLISEDVLWGFVVAGVALSLVLSVVRYYLRRQERRKVFID